MGKIHILKKSKMNKNKTNRINIDVKLHFSGEIDFESFLDGFWQVFGRPKSSIFVMFLIFFRSANLNAVWKDKKSKKWSSRWPRPVPGVYQPSGPTPQGRGRGGIMSYVNMRICPDPPLNALRPRASADLQSFGPSMHLLVGARALVHSYDERSFTRALVRTRTRPFECACDH